MLAVLWFTVPSNHGARIPLLVTNKTCDTLAAMFHLSSLKFHLFSICLFSTISCLVLLAVQCCHNPSVRSSCRSAQVQSSPFVGYSSLGSLAVGSSRRRARICQEPPSGLFVPQCAGLVKSLSDLQQYLQPHSGLFRRQCADFPAAPRWASRSYSPTVSSSRRSAWLGQAPRWTSQLWLYENLNPCAPTPCNLPNRRMVACDLKLSCAGALLLLTYGILCATPIQRSGRVMLFTARPVPAAGGLEARLFGGRNPPGIEEW